MRVLLTDTTLGINKGSEAMAIVVSSFLREKFEEIEILIEKSPSAPESFYSSYDLRSVKVNVRNTIINVLRLYRSGDVYIKPELVINLGGLNFQDASVRGSVRTTLKHYPFFLHRVPVIYFTQDFGPASKPLNRILGSYCLARAVKIFPRSKFSWNEARRLTGAKISGLITEPFPDCAFRLKLGEVPSEIQDQIEQFSSYRIVGIGVSVVLYNQFKLQYIEKLTELTKVLIRELNVKVVLLPHCYYPDQIDDSDVCQLIYNRLALEEQGSSLLIIKELEPQELKAISSYFDVLIGSRFHPLLACLSLGIPVIAISWNPKYKNLLSLFDQSGFAFSNFNELKIPRILNAVESVTKSDNIVKIRTHLGDVLRKVDQSFEELERCIKTICVKKS